MARCLDAGEQQDDGEDQEGDTDAVELVPTRAV